MGQRVGARLVKWSGMVSIVVGVVGLIASLVLNAFVLDKFDAYGEVPIPGTGQVHLPAGEVTASFHIAIPGGGGNAGIPVPNLHLSVVPPPGEPQVQVREDIGASTIVNNDARVRVWVLTVPEEGVYEISTDGAVQGYINPRLAFGHGSQYGWLWMVFTALIVLGIVELIAGIGWSVAAARRPRPHQPRTEFPPDRPAETYAPSDSGVRLEQLRQLAALRDSGALTEDEFQAEKRRILNDGA